MARGAGGGRNGDGRWLAQHLERSSGVALGPDAATALSRASKLVRYPRGSLILEAGEPAPDVVVVIGGSIALRSRRPADHVVVGVLRPGGVEGDVALLTGIRQPHCAEALDDAVCLRIDCGEFTSMVDRLPELGRAWLGSLALRLTAAHRRQVILLGTSLPQQVARLLLDEADAGEVPYAQAIIAALLGARRPSVNRIVRQFEAEGLVRLGYRSVTITDRTQLAERADSR